MSYSSPSGVNLLNGGGKLTIGDIAGKASLTDIKNNNLDKVASDDSMPGLKHTKFCFSRDISEKEESLRSCCVCLSDTPCHQHYHDDDYYNHHSLAWNEDTTTAARNLEDKKRSVTFTNDFPVYLDINKRTRDASNNTLGSSARPPKPLKYINSSSNYKCISSDMPGDEYNSSLVPYRESKLAIAVVDTEAQVQSPSETDLATNTSSNSGLHDEDTFTTTTVHTREQGESSLELSSHVIKKAQSKLTCVWHQIEYLLLATHDPESEPLDLPSPRMSGNYLIEIISSIEVAVSKLDKNYRKALNNPVQVDKLSELASANRLLRDQLKYAKTMKECLESEVKYMTRENAMMNEELNQLTVRFAMNGCGCNNNTKEVLPSKENLDQNKSPEVKTKDTEVFYQNHHRSFQHSNSNTSDLDESHHTMERDRDNSNKVGGTTGQQTYVEEEKNINRKWESVFNPIMECAEGRVTEIEELRMKLRNYEKELEALEETVSSVDSQKIQLMDDLEMLVEQQKVLLREKDRYESMLQWILKEKECSIDEDFMANLHDLLERLFDKVHYICCNQLDGDSPPRGCLHCKDHFLEGAVQAVQEQNGVLRSHISNLRDELAAAKAISIERTKDAQKTREEATEEVNKLRSELKEKDEVISKSSSEAELKYKTLQDLHEAVSQAKEALEQSIQDKNTEMSGLKSKLEQLQKTNSHQQKKIVELQTTNAKLVQEINELQHSMKKLSAIISSLRSNFKEQKAEWSDRVKAVTEEASQSKEQCRWLQSTIDHMNQQLDDAHERIKAHENDKAQLAQQVILADEERRIVERKLNDLRSALQGDSYLREALIEKNEALQIEISRLQKTSLMGSILGGDVGGEPTTVFFGENASAGDKHTKKSQRHPLHPPRSKPNEILRTAVSLHTGAGNSSG